MASLGKRLGMIGHGTLGADGIPPGNHLRWAHDRRLGFPLGGYRLYRRTSAGLQLSLVTECINWYEDAKYPAQFPLPPPPAKQAPNLDGLLRCRVPAPPVVVRRPLGSAFFYLEVKDRLEIQFPQAVQWASIEAYFDRGDGISLEAFNSRASADPLFRDFFRGPPGVLGTLETGKGPFDRLVIRSDHAWIKVVCYSVLLWVERDGSPWRLISDDPITLPYTHVNYPLKHDHAGERNGDWKEAEERLAAGDTYEDRDFQHMVDVLADVFAGEPAGSLMIRKVVYPAERMAPGPARPKIEVLPSDLLLLTSVDPLIARVEGLYFIDATADPLTYYDYRIEGTWTSKNIWLLEEQEVDFDDRQPGEPLFAYFMEDTLVFGGDAPTIVAAPSALAETERALRSTRGGASRTIAIHFPRPVSEVQLFVSGFLDGTSAAGFEGDTQLVIVAAEPAVNEQILRLSGPGRLEWVILKGHDPHLHKVRYSAGFLGDVLTANVVHDDMVTRLRMLPHRPPPPPTGLVATVISGATRRAPDGTPRDARLSVGLRWTLPPETSELFPNLPDRSYFVRYRLRRRNPDGALREVTRGAPSVVSAFPRDFEGIVRDGWPTERQFVVDAVPRPGAYQYEIAGIDLFGRESGFSEPVTVEVKADLYPPPAPPKHVRARLIDPADPWLSADDRTWLTTVGEGTWGLAVSWEWPAEYAEQSPDVSQFHVHAQPGWLNTRAVTIESVTENRDATATVRVTGSTLDGLADGDLVGARLQSQRRFYAVTAHLGQAGAGAATTAELSVRVPTIPAPPGTPVGQALVAMRPVVGAATVAAIPGTRAYADYSTAEAWHLRRLATVPRHGAVAHDLIVAAPPVPLPSTAEPKVYLQVSVTADDGRKESVTAAPASTFGVWRQPPATPTQAPGADLYASFPDVQGRAHHTVRWAKEAESYEVLRAPLARLIKVDQARRASGDLEADDTGLFAASTLDYAGLTNDDLHGLANLAGNQRAFSKLNEGTLEADTHLDPDDQTQVAYTDASLPGLGSGAYFYRVRAVDSVGNASGLGPASWPVWLRDVGRPRPPAVVRVVAGDRHIRLVWKANPERYLAEYRVYRAADIASAQDVRLMDLVLTAGADEHIAPLTVEAGAIDLGPRVVLGRVFAVYRADEYDTGLGLSGQTAPNYYTADSRRDGKRVVGIDLPTGTAVVVGSRDTNGDVATMDLRPDLRSWQDAGAIPGQSYYYRLVAVRRLGYDDGRTATVASLPSPVLEARVYEAAPPVPPAWIAEGSGWVWVDETGAVHTTEDPPTGVESRAAVQLRFSAPDRFADLLVQRQVMGAHGWQQVRAWAPIAEIAAGRFEWRDDGVRASSGVIYRAKVRSAGGLISAFSSLFVLQQKG